MGPLFIVAFYCLVGLHLYAYFTVVLFVLRKRLGTALIKPGGPDDLKRIEQTRKELKKREARKGISRAVQEEDGSVKIVDDDRFEGMSSEVKKLLKYRNKTIT